MDDKIDSATDSTYAAEPGPYSVGAAQAEILKMLESEEDTSNDSEEAIDESEVELEAEGEASGDEDIEEELLEAESEEFEDDVELDDDEEDSQGESDADEVFTVRVDGEEIEVGGLDELKAGYSRQADYTKKSQALAEERKGFQQDRDAVVLERQQYAQLLGALQTQIQASDEQAPDFDQLYDSDPIEAARQERQWTKQRNERANKLAAIQAEQARVHEAGLKESESQMQELLNAEVVRLPDLIPSWKDPKVAERESTELREYLNDQGISEDEMGALVRASHISVLRKAMLFDRGKKNVRKAAKAKRKNSVQPGSRSAQSKPGTKKIRAQRQRLAKTGKVQDASALIESLL